MTQQVRNSYRNHRRRAWTVMLAVLAAAALVVVVPALASTPGASIPPPSGQGVTPTDVNVGGSNFDCALNTGGVPAGLRTFQISAPPNSSASVTYDSTNTASTSTPLPAGVTFTLKGYNGTKKGKYFDFSAAGTGLSVRVFHVAVKGGTDNAWYDYYDNASTHGGVTGDTLLHGTLKGDTYTSDSDLYTASITTFCYALTTSVSGRVYEDRNGDGSYGTGTGGTIADVPKAWTVNLFQKVNGNYTLFATTTSSSSDGTYRFDGVPTGSDYVVCTVAAGSDAASTWGLRAPTGNTACGPLSNSSAATSAGNLIPALSSAATGQDFSVAPAVGPFGQGNTITTTNYTITGAGDKTPELYSMDTWAGSDGNQYFQFSPLTPCTGCGQIYLLETLSGDVAESTLSGGQVQLKYDDTTPYTTLVPMPYCQDDPRNADGTLSTDSTAILPSGATSCIVTGAQSVNQGSSPTTVHFEYKVYTSFDGTRGVG